MLAQKLITVIINQSPLERGKPGHDVQDDADADEAEQDADLERRNHHSQRQPVVVDNHT